MSKLNIVVLAAGLGKRMHSGLPKVLHHLAGKPLLVHVLDTARALSPEKICVVYGHGGEMVPAAIPGADLTWVRQEPQLGTGHALMQALPHLDKKGLTLVLYGDVPLIKAETLERLIAVWEPTGQGVFDQDIILDETLNEWVVVPQAKHLVLLTVEREEPKGYGRVVRLASGEIVSIVEERDATRSQRAIREVNTGMMAVPNVYLHKWLPRLTNDNAQKEYYLTDVVAMAADEGIAVTSVQPGHAWETFGVNSKGQLAEIERIFQRELAVQLMESGVTLADPNRFDARGELACGRDVVIDVNCIFEGTVSLGDHVRIGANCILKNVTIAAGTQVAPFSHVEDAAIGRDCRIGPYARIRPGTRLDHDVHIGNFVEVKASAIGARSKANHLSYLGDSVVGRNVNIGAGTITCNYDGVNKHQTIIEDEVFVGSNAALVAPVRIAKGATIGAGSTITKDTPPDQLTISRAKQVSIAGWKRPMKKDVKREG